MNTSTGTTEPLVCVITGATSGIGRATASAMAARGAHVVMVCRNQRDGNRVRDEIITDAGPASIDVIEADLRRVDSVRHAATTIRDRYERVDVLIDNAGVIRSRRRLTVDGVEETFAVNHLGHFVLTTELIDLLRASAPARVVVVASSHHKAGRIRFDDLQGEDEYDQNQAYCQSKLANVLFSYELARRLEDTGVTVNCLHPGATRTNFSAGLDGVWGALWKLTDPFRQRPETAARAVVHLATSPSVADITGGYFVKTKQAESSKESYDLETAERLWQVSEQLSTTATKETT